VSICELYREFEVGADGVAESREVSERGGRRKSKAVLNPANRINRPALSRRRAPAFDRLGSEESDGGEESKDDLAKVQGSAKAKEVVNSPLPEGNPPTSCRARARETPLPPKNRFAKT